MHTLCDLTQFVTFHNECAQEQLWEWFSAQVYERILHTERDSLIVRAHQRFDLHAVAAACEGYRHDKGGAGRPANYPVLRLCWALLLRYLHGWSLRTLEQQMRTNLLVRWCTRFALQEQTPDHSTLARFESWMREHALDVLFVAVLAQIDDDFADDARELLCGDTFGVRANIADGSLTTLLRQCCRRLLLAWQAALPSAYAACVAPLDQVALFGAADERPEQNLSPEAKAERTLRTAQAATHCLALVQPLIAHLTDRDAENSARAQLHKWADVVEKILADEFTDKPLPLPKNTRKSQQTQPADSLPDDALSAAPGQPSTEAAALPPTPVAAMPDPACPALRRCTDAERGAFRIVSAVDTDASVRKHGGAITLGYNAAILASANFVRSVQLYTGATPDGATVAPSLATHLRHFGFAPKRIVYDRAAGTPKHTADVRRTTKGQTQLVARQINYGQRHTRFAPTDFTLAQGALSCPNGVTSTTAYRARTADGFNFRFTAVQCQACPLWTQCRDPKSDPRSHRVVFISDYAFLFKAELAYLATPDAVADFSFRANVERHIAALTLHNGARRARVRGLLRVYFQLIMAATAYNLKRWHTLTLQRERTGQKERDACPPTLYPPA